MDNNNCKHSKWKYYASASAITGTSYLPALVKCTECQEMISLADSLQLKQIKHVTGFKKWLDVIAIVLASLSLGVSLYILLKP